jgi:hypothetical protein
LARYLPDAAATGGRAAAIAVKTRHLMSAPPSGKGEPVCGKRELVEYLERGC